MSATLVGDAPLRMDGGRSPGPPEGQRFGLTTATALVVGSVIGTGVFALPSALAGFGPISLVAFGLVTVGAIALALTFSALNTRLAQSGGPYVYAREAFGDFAGFLNAWSYWITAWAGNAAIVAAGRVVNPARNVGRATVLGTLACAAVYILGTVAVFGTVSHEALVASTAPFVDSANAIFGGQWAGDAVAVAAIVSGFGALVGWTLIVGEMPQAAARDRLFPAAFARESRRGVPAYGIVAGTILASALTVVSYSNFAKVFTTVVLLSVLTAVIPYLFSAAAQVYRLLTDGRRIRSGHLLRDLAVAVTALLFGFWALAGSGYQAAYYGLFCLLLGLPVYIWLKVGADR